MSKIACKYCGATRTVEQAGYEGPEGLTVWSNPACWNCGAPGWEQRAEDDPYETQPPGWHPPG